ncbi:6,7-dimethyl-8-ribityllumazine synthase [Nitrosomonas sp. HPC101]|uniref:6,7-dimethyl-8-ribityllumazine synthase n=1 Tax=Nitrosomonas sp. HPC101 TaxID=1658667 RepID=UPI00137226CF|nr:6,7-dimethyl-8-ribityllumazine synthase [Nitrosomonas sp. HPC101]MXS86290.1 6,7-dimethyl-8-ribityllumazine synthase [Nitrosomonas sp. HPC101]
MSYYDNILEIDSDLKGSGLCIGIVMSRFNIDISEGLLGACTAELAELGVQETDIVLITVPGALEIPLALQKLAASDRYDALIALGAVIHGETYHFDVVANESARGLITVGLEYDIPIANGVLTTDDEEQASVRMTEKGAETARVAVEMANLALMLGKMDQFTPS